MPRGSKGGKRRAVREQTPLAFKGGVLAGSNARYEPPYLPPASEGDGKCSRLHWN
jgi:hypothetical protein